MKAVVLIITQASDFPFLQRACVERLLGGAYLTGFGEPATGLSVYMERVFRGLPEFMPKQHIYIPTDIPKQTMLKYIDRGRCVTAGRYKSDDKLALEEAKQLKCTFILLNSISPPEKIE